MCYKVDCKQCGKYSWGGCGRHLTTLYANIEQGKHCMCRPWPGVNLSSPAPPATANKTPSASGRAATSVPTAVSQRR